MPGKPNRNSVRITVSIPGDINDMMRAVQNAGMYKMNPSQLLQAAIVARCAEIDARESALIRMPH